jgi:hypothetical protein
MSCPYNPESSESANNSEESQQVTCPFARITPNMMNGFSSPEQADDEIQAMLDVVKPDIEKKFNDNLESLYALSFICHVSQIDGEIFSCYICVFVSMYLLG